MNTQVTARWSIPEPGDVIAGKYLVESECGRDALAVVLAATHRELKRRVAIKLMRPEWSGRKEALDRFLREGYAPARACSEHAVRVFEVDRLASGAPYVVFECLEGDDLRHVVQAHGPLPVPVAVDWALQVAHALANAHARGVVHRDIKPSNLVLTTDAHGTCCIKLVDFGSAKIAGMDSVGPAPTAAQMCIGSPEFMAPEQLRAGDTDQRVDIWALGAVLHYLLTGDVPFRARSTSGLIAAILPQPPPSVSSSRNDVPARLESAILRCLDKNPDLRFQSMAELVKGLMQTRTEIEAPPDAVFPAPAGVDRHTDSAELDRSFFEEPMMIARSDSTSPGGTEDGPSSGAPPFWFPATSGTIVPALLALGVLGGLAFSGAYYVVHRHDAQRLAELRATAVSAPVQPPPVASAAPPPVTPPAIPQPDPLASGKAAGAAAPATTMTTEPPRKTRPSRPWRPPTRAASSAPSLARPSVEEPPRVPDVPDDDNPYGESPSGEESPP